MNKAILTLLIGTTFASLCGFAQAGPATGSSPRKIMVIAHRGEHLKHPENTLPAFQAAVDAGADYFELDVRTTSDGKLVLMHDSTVDRTTNGTGAVHDMTFDQIRALDAGSKFSPAFAGTKVPTLDEAFDLAHGKINVYVDTKHADAQQLIDTIERHDMQDHVVIYGNPFFLYDVHKINPALKIMPEAGSPETCKFFVRALQLKVLAFDAGDFKDGAIDCAKQAGAQIFVDRLGDADNPETWQKAIDEGANGIQTNLPAELVTYLRAHNMATH
ncbi:glycerophosphodiester phosphodiesterase [Paracidobacterium acidisoli]|uniref:Glycerophosphodiester phosphodiesterase n=1 Tax=Paracidobacterium acidisoli TaxID=2303751 RepID=A0A372IRU5_9BACT|nr:glycerophosphodiester phosphodiesterase family protein [Paracidobacterium acidisoli]MBT9330602.1 glycerophosphodiester phosphodiesterase family protein [Paracidobacterium acidisoli]